MSRRTARKDGRFFAACRVQRLETLHDLELARAHANRDPGAKFEIREGAIRGDSLRWIIVGDYHDFDLVEAFKDHKAKTGARERQGAALAMNIQFMVSPEFIVEAGDLHDLHNARNQLLIRQATKFANEHIGGVFAARLDLDEIGGAVVDVFASPVRERQAKQKKDSTRGAATLEISCNKALHELRGKAGGSDKTDYGALQTMWARYAAEHMDKRIERGEPKRLSGRIHLETHDFKELKERENALAQAEAKASAQHQDDKRDAAIRAARLAAELAEAEERRREAEEQRAELTAREAELERRERVYSERLAGKRAELAEKEAELAQRETKVTEDRLHLEREDGEYSKRFLEQTYALEARERTSEKQAEDVRMRKEHTIAYRKLVSRAAEYLSQYEEVEAETERELIENEEKYPWIGKILKARQGLLDRIKQTTHAERYQAKQKEALDDWENLRVLQYRQIDEADATLKAKMDAHAAREKQIVQIETRLADTSAQLDRRRAAIEAAERTLAEEVDRRRQELADREARLHNATAAQNERVFVLRDREAELKSAREQLQVDRDAVDEKAKKADEIVNRLEALLTRLGLLGLMRENPAGWKLLTEHVSRARLSLQQMFPNSARQRDRDGPGR